VYLGLNRGVHQQLCRFPYRIFLLAPFDVLPGCVFRGVRVYQLLSPRVNDGELIASRFYVVFDALVVTPLPLN